MIAQIPYQLPSFDRPYVLVLAPADVREKLARELEPSFDSVVIAGADLSPLYLRVFYSCLEDMCGVACWLPYIDGGYVFGDKPFRPWIELGGLIERCPERLVLGIKPEILPTSEELQHIAWLMTYRGFRVWDNQEDVITSARQLRRRGPHAQEHR